MGIEKGKISSYQAAVLVYMSIISTALLYLPNITAIIAGNDLWISPIWASICGFLVVLVIYKLSIYYPNKTFIEYLPLIIGRIPGKLLGLFYIIFFLNVDGRITRSYTEFMLNAFLKATPKSVIIFSFLIVCAFCVRSGVEVLGRAAQFFFPFIILSLLCIVSLLSGDFDSKHLFPILENGFGPSFEASIHPATWMSEVYYLAFLLPYVSNQEKALKWQMLAVVAALVTMSGMNLAILLLFGINVEVFLYPILMAARYISMADFLENLESLIVVIWVVGLFVKISLGYYVATLAAAQWLQLSDYRPIVLPIGLLIVGFSLWGIPNLSALVTSGATGSTVSDLLFRFVLPMVLFGIAVLRRKTGGSGQGGIQNGGAATNGRYESDGENARSREPVDGGSTASDASDKSGERASGDLSKEGGADQLQPTS